MGKLLPPEPEGGVAQLHTVGGSSPGQLGCRMDRGTEEGSSLMASGSRSSRQGRNGAAWKGRGGLGNDLGTVGVALEGL